MRNKHSVKKSKWAAFAICALCTLFISGELASAKQPMSIVETAVGSGQTNTLVKLLQAADLVEAVSGPGPLTILAPTDDAFAKLPPALVKKLLDPANQAMLQDILKYHVVVGKALAADVVKLKEIPTLAGPPIKVSMRDGNVYLNDSKVIATDIECSNGVIHLIDAVLLPPTPEAAPEEEMSMPASTCPSEDGTGTIVDVAVGNGSFGTLVAAVTAADLVETLQSPGPFTVFGKCL